VETLATMQDGTRSATENSHPRQAHRRQSAIVNLVVIEATPS
jgi:hypothetical protein